MINKIHNKLEKSSISRHIIDSKKKNKKLVL